MGDERGGWRLSHVWSLGEYERIAERFGPIHDELVASLAPRPRLRWLDVATGTGEVALRAARAGAEVAALDISERLLGEAREKAGAEGLAIDFELGDAQSLPYDEGEFDVVSSCFGVIFAPDRHAAAGELRRVCRPGGRLGLTAWRPKPELRALYERFQERPPAADSDAWGEDAELQRLLGSAFELELSPGTWPLEGESPEAVFRFMAEAAPPLAAFLESLSEERLAEVREAFVDYWRRFEVDGAVREPRGYVLAVGRRR
ncbi:MAG: methyltransferase domain-containing protein [Actinobacteria bacterium]|nr:methyltransferase domain-containing protein [Actinomycetota bacterium]